MIQYKYPYEYDSLPLYAKFLLENKLEELSSYQLGLAYEYDLPLLKKLAHFNRDQLLELTKQGYVEFLNFWAEGKLEEQINSSLEKWNRDELEIIGKFDIEIEDITFINDIRQRSLNAFVQSFTNDPQLQEKILYQIGRYIVIANTSSIAGYVFILKQQINKKENQLLEAQALAKIGSFEWDLINDVSETTPELKNIFGETRGQEYWMQNVHPEDRARVEKSISDSLQNGHFDAEYRYILNGKEKIILSRGEVLYNADKRPALMRGTVQDITEWKNILTQLHASIHEQEELKLSNEYKDEFMNIASHELKTPLTGIKAYLQLALETKNINEATGFVNRGLTHVKKLEKLIADLLDTSKLNAGQLLFNKEEFDLKELLEEIYHNFTHRFPDRTIHFTCEDSLKVYADRIRTEQVINNLTENALKYSQDEISISAHASNENICVDISDSGIGISEEDQENLFNRFFRSSAINKSHQGLGLGLYIAGKIMEHHGGTIEVKSKLGEGSCFTVCIPSLHSKQSSKLSEKAVISQ